MSTINLTVNEWQTLKALCNGLIPDLHASGAGYKQEFENVISITDKDTQFLLRVALHALSYRATAFPMTGSHILVTEMSPVQLNNFLVSLSNSRLRIYRMLISGMLGAGLLAYYRQSDRFRKFLGEDTVHPRLLELRDLNDPEEWFIPQFRVPRPLTKDSPSLVSTDVAIVGTGCSAMVAAYYLTALGYNVILVEKGYHLSRLTTPEQDYAREMQSFESLGAIPSHDASILVLAGATVGGGGAVNWSCSLRTPEKIRNEWVKMGAKFYGERIYDEALNKVEEVMKVSTDFGEPHSFTNQLILDASKQLGYAHKETPQNTGKHRANNGFIEFGNRSGVEKGGIGEWFRQALQNGAQIVQRAVVTNIRHNGGHASGLDVVVNGNKHLVLNCKRVVVAGGSIQTPALLQRSGFKNKHIGKGLKLHPVTVAFGQFPEVVNKRTDPIMTAVSTEVDNLDGEAHGPKIEAIHHRPHLIMTFVPWKNGGDWQEKVNNYKHLSSLLVITRDKGEGSVTFDKKCPLQPRIDYTPCEYDLWALKQGCLASANMLYIKGARRIFSGNNKMPDFSSDKPVEQRSIWDADFCQWKAHVEAQQFLTYDTRVGSAHQMGTCRLSSFGPQHGAVDGRGRLYECKNVHVIDTSVFPSASGVNPMISCMATAYCLTQFLIDDLNKAQTKL